MVANTKNTFLLIVLFLALLFSALFVMNVPYKYFLAPIFAIIGVLAYPVIMNQSAETESDRRGLRINGLESYILLALHILVAIFWLLVPPSPSLFYADWSEISGLLVLRGAVAVTYSSFVPGLLIAYLLDVRKQLSKLELLVFGNLVSIFAASVLAYSLFAFHYDLNVWMFPGLWLLTTFLVTLKRALGTFGLRLFEDMRPPSFPSSNVRNLLASIVALLIASILAINVSWRVLLAGDLWTHAAQTAYILQGDTTVPYPWIFHFLSASIRALTGLPIINVMQLLQVLAVMPALALYVTLSAIMGRNESKIPIFATLFFATFMGLGWSSYLWIRNVEAPIGSAAIYGVEYIAGQLTYDIIEGVGAYRIAFVPASISITALIYSLRLMRGFSLPKVLIAFGSFTLTALMILAHLFEVGFFTAILAASAIFLWDSDYQRTLTLTTAGSATGFAFAYLIDYLSPTPQQLFTSYEGNFYVTGFEYSLFPLILAVAVVVAKRALTNGLNFIPDVVDRLYSPLGARLKRLEGPIIRISAVVCILLGVVFGLVTITNQPFFAWLTAATGNIPWNYYPIRLGIVTLFAVIGSIILLLREEDLRLLFEFLSLGVIAILVGRLTYLFGLRPQGFGENRVMDLLWIGAVVLAAYGLTMLTPKLIKWMGTSAGRREFYAVVMIFLVLAVGASSFLLFVDADIEGSTRPGLVPTASDMIILNYIVAHRDAVGFILTAPTLETQYLIRKFTLNSPYGYGEPFTTPSIFTSATYPELLEDTQVLSSLRVFLSSHDLAFLQTSGFVLSSYYLAYQQVIVDAGDSFLMNPSMLHLPSGGSLVGLYDETSLGNFFLVSALSLSTTSYSLQSFKGIVNGSSGSIILGEDPSLNATYLSAIAWAQNTGGTLIVVSNLNQPGLFERDLFGDLEENSTFNATSVIGNTGQTYSYSLPFPLAVHPRHSTNATVVSLLVGNGASTPLSYLHKIGKGQILLLMLRDYYQQLANTMFTDTGRELYAFLPSLFRASGVQIMP